MAEINQDDVSTIMELEPIAAELVKIGEVTGTVKDLVGIATAPSATFLIKHQCLNTPSATADGRRGGTGGGRAPWGVFQNSGRRINS